MRYPYFRLNLFYSSDCVLIHKTYLTIINFQSIIVNMNDEARNPTVILDYISHEIAHSYDNFPPEVRAQLSEIARRQLARRISFEEAAQLFMQHCAGDALPHKIKQILEVSDVPLPPPADQQGPAVPKGTRRKSYPWTDAEDTRLLVAVSRFGAKDWRLIAEFVGAGRNSSQCNQRWCRALDPSISHKSWTEADDAKLMRAVEVLGKASWCQVAKIMTGRTDLQCRYRYLQLVKATDQGGGAGAEKGEPQQNTAEADMEMVMLRRRNSISIARFTIDLDEMEKMGHTDPKAAMIPYYLHSTLEPRADAGGRYLHRVPPLLCSRVAKK